MNPDSHHLFKTGWGVFLSANTLTSPAPSSHNSQWLDSFLIANSLIQWSYIIVNISGERSYVVNRQSSIVNRQSNSVKNLARLSSAICLALSVSAYAADQVYTATFTGSGGATGAISYTVDSALAAVATNIMASLGCGPAAPVLKAFSFTITGGSTPGGSQTWNCSHVSRFYCGNPAGASVPCSTMLIFNLDANANTYTFVSSGPVDGFTSWTNGTVGGMVVGSTPVSAPIFDLKPAQVFATEVEK